MRLNEKSIDDIEYINYHCYRPTLVDPLFPYLFYKNKDVQRHNEKMHLEVYEQLITLEAIDEIENSQENLQTYDKTSNLPAKLLINKKMLVELYAGNYNIEYGLVNGADGAFKSYSKDKKQFDVVWVEFVYPIVGKLQREKFHEFYDEKNSPTWTPIFCVINPLSLSKERKQTNVRKQFPIQLACARTIHRAQGLTLDRLAFDPGGIRTHGLVYIALSRVKTMDSLYLIEKLSQ